MAVEAVGALRDAFEAFVKGAYLDVLVPQASTFDAATLLRDATPELLTKEPIRKLLFFDELATIHLVLRTSIGRDAFLALLPHFDVTVAAHASNAVPDAGGNAATASGKHDLATQVLPAQTVPELVGVGDQTYAVWKTRLHLSRPRVRLQRPIVYFTAIVSLNASALQSIRRRKQEYLPSYEPLPTNVLEPLLFDSALNGASVFLPDTMITKVAPAQSTALDSIRPIRGASKRAFPAVPALMLRVRYSPLPDCVLASVHLETSQLAAGGVTLLDFKLEASSARVAPVNNMEWPKRTHPGDEMVMCYKLRPPYDALTKSHAPPATLRAEVTGAAILDAESKTELNLRWQGQVELTDPITKPPLKWSRPFSASLAPSAHTSLQPGSRPASFEDARGSAETDAGMTLTFTGPPTTRMNEDFTLDIFVMNKSGRPRRLALISIQPKQSRRQRASMQRISTEAARPGSSSERIDVRPKPPQVLDLNADVRVGPLPAGACFETMMRFRAFATGVLDLGIIRVVDLDTRQTVDVRDLPDVVSLEPLCINAKQED